MVFNLKGEDNQLPLLFSAALPGGGQLYNGKYLKSITFASLETYFFIQAYRYNQFKQQEKEGRQRDRLRRTRDTNIWLGFGIALLGFGDAIVDNRFMTFKKDILKKDDKLSIKTTSQGLALVYEF